MIRNRITKIQDKIDVEIMWIPSHCGIKGNEMADQLAAEATQNQNLNFKYKKHFMDYIKTFRKEIILK